MLVHSYGLHTKDIRKIEKETENKTRIEKIENCGFDLYVFSHDRQQKFVVMVLAKTTNRVAMNKSQLNRYKINSTHTTNLISALSTIIF